MVRDLLGFIVLGVASLMCWIMMPLLAISAPNDDTDGKPLLRIAGWDVYADPERPDKTIGYEAFEQATNVRIVFTPLSNLDEIVDEAESNNNYDLFIVSNEGIKILFDMGLVLPLDLSKIRPCS
jgi:spermidine/putrescine-binding protein